MYKQLSLAAALAAATMLAACGGGGGGGSGDSGGSGSGSTSGTAKVAGPLDTAQTAVSSSVIAPLSDATAGTPVQGLLLCADSLVNQNVLDLADSFANSFKPSSTSTITPAEAQATVEAMIANLSGLLEALAGDTGCTGGAAGGSGSLPTTNPLAGTPLEAFGAQLLAALTSAQAMLPTGSGTTLSSAQLYAVLMTLSNGFDQAVAQLPAQATTAPVLGGVIITAQDALHQLETLALLASTNADPSLVAQQLQALTESVINNLLTQVLPVGDLQGAAGGGASTDLAAQLQNAISLLTAGLATHPTTSLPSNPLGGAGFASLADLVAQFQAALPDALAGLPNGASPLAGALAIQTLIQSLLAPLGGGSGGACILHFLGLC